MSDVEEKRPRCFVFETMKASECSGAGCGLAFGARKNGRAVLYQERRNRHPIFRYRSVVTWEKVTEDQLEHELSRAARAGYDVNELVRIVERRARG